LLADAVDDEKGLGHETSHHRPALVIDELRVPLGTRGFIVGPPKCKTE
jgi:hypothetical protein